MSQNPRALSCQSSYRRSAEAIWRKRDLREDLRRAAILAELEQYLGFRHTREPYSVCRGGFTGLHRPFDNPESLAEPPLSAEADHEKPECVCPAVVVSGLRQGREEAVGDVIVPGADLDLGVLDHVIVGTVGVAKAGVH